MFKQKPVYLFVCPNMADWEPAFVISMISDRYTEIPKNRSYPIITFSLTTKPVKTFGGLTIIPDTDIENVDPENAAMVILPGSSLYEKEDPAPLVPLIKECLQRKIPVAAICGGTLFLARHGFLDTVRHTSAGQEWLKNHAPNYRGGDLYVDSPSVVDGGIITANPLGFVEFAANIFTVLDVFPSELQKQLISVTKQGYINIDTFGRDN